MLFRSPGEKLYEEILMNEEGLEKTSHDKIFVAEPIHLTVDEIENKLKKLQLLLDKQEVDLAEVKSIMKEVVPTFREPEKVNYQKEG